MLQYAQCVAHHCCQRCHVVVAAAPQARVMQGVLDDDADSIGFVNRFMFLIMTGKRGPRPPPPPPTPPLPPPPPTPPPPPPGELCWVAAVPKPAQVAQHSVPVAQLAAMYCFFCGGSPLALFTIARNMFAGIMHGLWSLKCCLLFLSLCVCVETLTSTLLRANGSNRRNRSNRSNRSNRIHSRNRNIRTSRATRIIRTSSARSMEFAPCFSPSRSQGGHGPRRCHSICHKRNRSGRHPKRGRG